MVDAPAVVLVVDDDRAIREALQKVLAKEGYAVLLAEGGEVGLEVLRREEVHLLLVDLKMPRMSGLELLKAARAIRPEVEVIVITGHGSIEEAVEAMKAGAYDFITKPFKRLALERTVEKALEKQALVRENRALRARLAAAEETGRIIGASPAMQRTLDLVAQVAPSAATVLIQGESGTGKELIADALHRQSPRRDRPFVKVNCAALPETLLESELFGYERGAFTGAVARKEGRFELADGGTLFLDEVGDLSLTTQAKLLRVLQEGTFERLGGTRTLQVDVRLVAATNRDLTLAVQARAFREDLYYRLNVITLTLPPLRERREDIPLLASRFAEAFAAKNSKTIRGFTPEALDLLQQYPWPGNVRELENSVERAVVLTRDDWLGVEDLPEAVAGGAVEALERTVTIPLGMPLEEVERLLIDETLKLAKGDKTIAAKLLGIASRTIYRKLKATEPEADSARNQTS